MNDARPRIMIVDDAPINIQILNEAIQSEYRTCFATNGPDALKLAAEVRPDLILLDIMMPGMDGYEVCRQLQADHRLAAVPVIFVTALAQQESEAIGLDLGAVDYVTKPVNPELVRLRIRNQLKLKRQRDQLAELNVELEQRVYQRTAALETAVHDMETFCYAVSHDLRAPLRHINAFSTMLLERTDTLLDEEARADLSRIGAAALRAGALVDALLSLPRLCRRELKLTTVNLSELVRGILARQAATDPKRETVLEIASGVQAEGDLTLLRAALEQLLDNAWKFTAGRTPTRISFWVEQHNGQEVYCVGDNGAGFDMAYRDKLFGIFQRLHREGEYGGGLGVGLATVQRIIAAHGGEMRAEGEVDRGATFRFTLGNPFPAGDSLAAIPQAGT